ncbi:PH domain-containing protein [Daejeonella sp.]|uniref:PH domain-containing protein n=1 Tax=Daejeonella sp. TaxID=2805397 RepID=UPI0030C1022E
MEFSNPELNMANLPRAEEAGLLPVDERYYTVLLYNNVLIWSIFFFILLVIMVINEEFHSYVAAGITFSIYSLLCFLSFRLNYLSFKNTAFAVREYDILYQKGWLIKSLHVCPFIRIQHCSVDAGVFERNLGIAKLKIYSSGGNNTDIVIPGLKLEEAQALRELIISKGHAE